MELTPEPLVEPDIELAAWIAGRERAALARLRLAALAMALILFALAAWLGVRQVRIAALPTATREAVARQSVAQARLRLKELSLAAYLAKVRNNSLLADVTGQFDLTTPCNALPTLRGLPDSSSCAENWLGSLRLIWTRAFGPDAPPIPEHLLRDPWGSPYLLNQAEAVCGHYGTWCPKDTIGSAGPEGRPNAPENIIEAIPQHVGPSLVH
jgi:hypothetical protein